MHLPILKRAQVKTLVRLGKNPIPMVKTLFEGQGILARLLRPLRIR